MEKRRLRVGGFVDRENQPGVGMGMDGREGTERVDEEQSATLRN
jgi:hypothetical protein